MHVPSDYCKRNCRCNQCFSKLKLHNHLHSLRVTHQARNKKDAFLLHSVGHMNKGWEVDASISYADYYYLEALVRLKRLKEKQSVLANL